MAAQARGPGAGSLALAIGAGAAMGMLLAAGNVYAGLRIGFTSDGSIVAAILSVVLIRTLGRLTRAGFSPLHTNLAQTAASAGAFSAVAGLTNAVPAMRMDGVEVSPWLLVPWVLFVAALGICIAVPLRRQAIEVEKLRFPSGTVCAQTIRTLHSGSAEARHGALALGIPALASAAFTWLRDVGLWGWAIPGKTLLPGSLGAFSLKKLMVGVSWSPLLFAVGGIIGLRAALSLALGASIAWVAGGPALAHLGIIDPEAERAVISWTVWPAVGIMTAGGLVALVVNAGVITRSLGMLARADDEVPRPWWLGGIAVCAAGASLAARAAFGVPVWQSLVAVVLALPIAAVAVRAVGETDISPSNNLAKATQFVFAAVAPGQTVANVAAAGVASGCAIEASEVMTDLKAGSILGNRARDQFIAQIAGVVLATGAAVAAYTILVAAIPLGQQDGLPAPTAVAWRTLADGLAGGKGAIPETAVTAAWIAAAAGALLGGLSSWRKDLPLPSPIAMGLGAIVPASYSVTILAGAATAALLGWYARSFWDRDRALLTSGLIVGESLTGLLAAALGLAGLV